MVDFPYAPEDLAVELRLGGTWVDLAAAGKIKLTDSIRIQRGKSGSTTGFSSPSPSSCQFTIKNNDGVYSPDNPLSPYYRDLGRGTAVRVATRVAKSTFSGTASNGFATPERGGAWTVSGTASRYSEGTGAGKIAFATANLAGLAYQAAQTYGSHDVAVTFTFPFSDVTGGSVGAGVVLGQLVGTDHFLVRLQISTAEVMTLDVIHESSGTTISFPVTISDFAFTGQAIRLRAQLAGQTIRARVWQASSVEPLTWHLEESYAFDALLDRAKGSAGVWGIAGTSNSNVPFTISYDNWEVRSNRYAGSIASLSVETDVTGKQVETKIQVGGPRRRLGQGSSPVDSPFKHAQSSYTTSLFSLTGSPPHLQYFPCEDASGSAQFASGLLEDPRAMIVASGSPQFASDSNFPGSLPIAKPNVSRWFAPRVVGASATGFAQLMFCLTVPSGGEVDAATLAQIQLSGTAGFVDIVYGTASSGRLYLVFYGQDRIAVHTSAALITGLNGTSQLISVELTQSGADISYASYGLSVGQLSAPGLSNTCPGQTIGTVRGFYATPYAQVTTCSLGHFALRNAIVSVLTFEVSFNAYSWPDVPSFEPYVETSLGRVQRMCGENLIPITYIRSPNINTDWTDMGKQGVSTALSIMDEATNADIATLFEDRDIEGFVYRYGRSKFNQNAQLTLNIASGQLAPPFAMPKDDQALLNDVQVKRKDGSSVRVTNDTAIAEQGHYDGSYTLNLWSDTQLDDRANWLLHLGTTDDPRYPSMQLDLARAARDSTQLYLDMLALDIDDRVVATNPNALVTSASLDLVAIGYTEVLSGKSHSITASCTPGGPWAVAEPATDSGDTNPWLGRLDTDGAVVSKTVSFVGANAGVSGNNASLSPTIHASATTGDLMLICAGIRTGAPATPAGWTLINDAGNAKLFGKMHSGSESTPTVTFSGGAAGDDTIAQLAVFRGIDLTTTRTGTNTSNASAQNITYTGFTSPVGASLAIMYGFKNDDWTSVATLGSAQEIGETVSTVGNDAGLVWDYIINQGTFTKVATGFVVTGGAAATAVSGTVVFPATSVPAGLTSLPVYTASGPLWTVVADDFPLYLDVNGVQVRATACSGAGTLQTFTVDALPTALAQGLPVSVWHLPVLGF